MDALQEDSKRPGAIQYRLLLARLDKTRRFLRTVVWAQSFLHAAIALLVIAPFLFILDNWLHFSVAWRLFGFFAIISLAAVAFGATVRVAFQRWSYERLAVKIEDRFPGLDNRLINAVQLGSAPPDPSAAPLLDYLVAETTMETSNINLRQAVNTKMLKRRSLLGLALAALVLLYAFFLPDYFRNAALRFIFPVRADILPITRIQMKIEPGDANVNKGDNLQIAAIPTSQDLPRVARLIVQSSRGGFQYRMDNDGNSFLYELTEITEDLKYRVKAGDFASGWFKVTAIEKPRVERLAVRYEYPAYTRLDPAVVDPSNGNLTALVGTRATVTAWTNKPVEAPKVLLGSGKAIPGISRKPDNNGGKQDQLKGKASGNGGVTDNLPVWDVRLEIKRNDTYQWQLKDNQGYDNSPALVHTIRATEDGPPRVVITSPRGAVEVPKGDDLNVLYSASDDYGLASVAIHVQSDKQTTLLRQTKFDDPKQTVQDGYILHTAEPEYEAGQEYKLTVTVTDTHPTRKDAVVSEPLVFRVVQPVQDLQSDRRQLDSILLELQRLLEEQIRLKGELEKWRVTLQGVNVTPEQRETILGKILFGQSTLRVQALALAATQAAPDENSEGNEDPWSELRGELQKLADAEMRQAVQAVEAIRELAKIPEKREQTDAARDIQIQIVKRLRELVGVLAAKTEDPEEVETPENEEDFLEEMPPRPDTLEDQHGAALDFRKDLAGAVKTLQEMENTNPEDFTTDQSQALEDLVEKEEEWSEYFKDAAEWLRESAMVESTESGLREELIEIYSEIHLLPEDQRHDPKTIEVSMENAGAELAEELTAELEKWLAEEPDFRKWVMENAPEDYEVPLVDLPDELTDMIGDLLETEETMTEEIEDVTSNWADSLDKGAGWEVGDGPISNYSAKGATGNLQPNDMDISGRAGEGRTGRSTGEIVESVADGKGGRDTQTRMTDDAMGDGRVEDLSTEQTGGVTGGGKIAGTSGYGLVSPTAPEQPDLVQNLVQKQADIRQQAISLQGRLMNANFPGASLDSSIRAMEQMEKALQEGRYSALRDLGAVVLTDLNDQKKVTSEHFRVRRDSNVSGGPKIRHEVGQGAPEDFPDEYRTLLSAYYEALSREDLK